MLGIDNAVNAWSQPDSVVAWNRAACGNPEWQRLGKIPSLEAADLDFVRSKPPFICQFVPQQPIDAIACCRQIACAAQGSFKTHAFLSHGLYCVVDTNYRNGSRMAKCK